MGTRPTAGAGLSVSLLFTKLKIPTENGNANGKRTQPPHSCKGGHSLAFGRSDLVLVYYSTMVLSLYTSRNWRVKYGPRTECP